MRSSSGVAAFRALVPLELRFKGHLLQKRYEADFICHDKVLVEISPYDLTRGRITYRERNAAAGPRPGGNRPGGPRRR